MEIIVSHLNLDFDSLASLWLAKKIYPEAVLVLHDSQERNVREYLNLTGLRRGFRSSHQIDLNQVTKLILVDTRQRRRLGRLEPLIERNIESHVFDHHPSSPDDIVCTYEHIVPVGATVTIIVEELIKRGIELTADEATLGLLGIYEDTGSLTYVTTKERDMLAAARLLRAGARLDLVRNFMYRPLNSQQRELCNKLLSSLENVMINEIPITFATAKCDSYVGDVAMIAHKLRDVDNVEVLFLILEMEDRVHVVARSRLDSVAVGDLLEPLGGGGHATAASASVVGLNLDEVLEYLKNVLHETIRPLRKAKDIMSVPVRTVREKLTIAEAKRLLLQLDHSGLPVVDDTGGLLGIITHRDIDKALQHHFEHAPVKGYMSTQITTLPPEASLHRVQKIMLENNIGRIPIVDEKQRLCGIITRGDLLRGMYGGTPSLQAEDTVRPTSLYARQNVKEMVVEQYGREVFHLLAEIGELAESFDMQVYLVGGMVRDLFLKKQNLDLDVVVEGNGLELGRRLAEKWSSRLVVHKRFMTAKITAPSGIAVDLATARTEYYEYPAALPAVSQGTIKHDLQRRDFSINAMAIMLNPESFGVLVDPHSGAADIANRCLRILYQHSFIDDPTRILRAILFQQRFALTMTVETERALANAVAEHALQAVSPQRLRPEIIELLGLPDSVAAVKALVQSGALTDLHPALVFTPEVEHLLDRVQGTEPPPFFWKTEYNRWILRALALFTGVKLENIGELVERFGFCRRNRETILRGNRWRADLAHLVAAPAFSSIYDRFKYAGDKYLAFLYLVSDEKCRRLLKEYATVLRLRHPHTGGEFLKKLGVAAGPLRSRLLEELGRQRLDGKISSAAEEEEWLRRQVI